MRGLFSFFLLIFTTLAALAQEVEDAYFAQHPLDALTAEEIAKTVELLTAEGRVDEGTRYANITLLEPPKAQVLAWSPGQPFQRTAFAVVRKDGSTFEAIVDLTDGKVVSVAENPTAEPMILTEEWEKGRNAFMADARFTEALKKRGYADTKNVVCTPNSSGWFPTENYTGRRVLKIPCFQTMDKLHPTISRPIEGLMGVVDAETGEVLDVFDREIVPLPKAPQGYGSALPAPDPQQNPVTFVAPEGPNIDIRNNLEIAWGRWSFHTRADKRAGLIVSLIRFHDGRKLRDITYQMNVSEMFVPYMDPNPTWSYRTFLDVGEFGLGYLMSSLAPDIDCPQTALFVDLTMPTDLGGSYDLERGMCVFERPTGDPAWRHFSNRRKEVNGKPQVELVVRTIPTIGNYDYVIDYVFSPQGNITLRVGATGFDAVKSVAAADMTSPTAAQDTAFGALIAPYTVAPWHDHYINFRLDLDIDGQNNSLVRDSFVPASAPGSSPRKSMWTLKTEPYTTEGPATVDHGKAGSNWRVTNSNQLNRLKQNPSYWLQSHHQAVSILAPDDPPQLRAGFSSETLWVTRYKPEELWAAGSYPNLSTEDLGLSKYVGDREPVANLDIVLWYTMGFRHATRPEDFPILPTFWHEMTLRPAFFFDMDPSMTFNPGTIADDAGDAN
jgi:primary-amine oxidase